MRRIPALFVLVALCLFFPCAKAQSPFSLIQDSSLSFQQIVQQAIPILDSLRIQNGGIPTHDEKVFLRWMEFWSGRVDIINGKIGGDLQAAQDYHLRQAQGEFPICDQSTANSAWSFVGPHSVVSFKMNMGVVTALARHPTDTMTIYAGCNFSGVWKTVDGGAHWRCLTDGLRLPLFAVHALVLDPDNPDIVYAGTGRTDHNGVRFGLGIFKSTDAGTTWAHIGPGALSYTAPKEVDVIRFHPTNHDIMVAAGRGQIHRTTDRGVHWTTVFGTQALGMVSGWDEFVDLEVCPSNPSVWLAATRENAGSSTTNPSVYAAELYVSVNAGQTWVCVNCQNPAPLPFAHTERIAISATAPDGYLYIAHWMHAQGVGKINLVKTNDGINFLPVAANQIWQGGPGFWKFVFEVSPTNVNRIYVGGIDMFIRPDANSPYGTNGSLAILHEDCRDLLVWPASGTEDRLLIATDGGIGGSKDSGANWFKKIGQGLTIAQYYGFDLQPSTGNLVAGAQDVGTWRYDGVYWRKVYDKEDGGWVEIDDHDENTTVFGGYLTWRNNFDGFSTPILPQNNMGVPGPHNGALMDRRAVCDPLMEGKYWSGDALTLKTIQANGPNPTWSAPVFVKPGADITHTLADIAISPSNPDVMYWAYANPFYSPNGIENAFFRSTDGCSTFTDITDRFRDTPSASTLLYQWQAVSDLEVDPNDPKHLMAALTGYGWDAGLQQARYKVYESTDQGDTWTDISKGLSPFPVNHIHMQNGGGGVAYAATDGGVYRFNPTLRVWECFNAGLPAARCSRVVIDYCRQKVLVGTFGRGIWEAPLPPVGNHHVTTSQTWEAGSVLHFANNVVVNPGVKLTIKGKVDFAAGKKLIVLYGGKVILQGGTLSTLCGGLWGGVELYGNPNYAHTINAQGLDPFHGIIEVKNGGTIENASTGITTALRDTQGNFLWNSFGGIVQCNGAKFLNNKIDVILMPFTRPNRSYFRNSLFETNHLLNANERPITHLSMWNVRNIPVEGCTFRYAAGGSYPEKHRGNGISGRDATYLVDWRCTAPGQNGCTAGTPTVFDNLVYGVDHASTNRLLSPSIRHSKFVQNRLCGIKLTTADYAAIEDNVFDVGPGIPSIALGTGVYVDRCTKYSLQSNQFTTTSTGAYGVIVNESGDLRNEVYNNDFQGVRYGISAQGDNEGPDPRDGLVMNCNDFGPALQYGIVVSGYGVGNQQGYDVQGQGNQALALVRNRYYLSCQGISENKFYVQLTPIDSIQHRCNSNIECQPLPQPSCSDANEVDVFVDPSNISLIKAKHCVYLVTNAISNIDSNIIANTNRLSLAQSAFDSIVDGGNTNQLLADLTALNHSQGIQNLVHSISPYLSDTVLGVILDRKTVVSANAYKTILIANSPLAPKLLARLDELNLAPGIKGQILAAQVGTSQREALKGDVYLWKNNLEHWQSEKLRFYLHDTLVTAAFDTVKHLVTALQLNPCYVAYAAGLDGPVAAIDSLILKTPTCRIEPSDFGTVGKELREMARACIALDMLLEDSTHEEAHDTLPICFAEAQVLYELFMNWNVKEYQYQPSESSSKTDGGTEVLDLPQPQDFKLYPNPAQSAITVEFVGEEDSRYLLRITDIEGRLVLETEVLPNVRNKIALKKQLSGVYVYQVIQNGLPWKYGKLLVD